MAWYLKHGLPVPCGAAWKRSVKNRDPRDAWMIVQRICGVSRPLTLSLPFVQQKVR
ncbi:nickel-dependent hydrogenase large subunit [Shigella flexneri]